MTAQQDRQHMRHALALGRRGMGQVWPNPAVGCVIVNHGRIVGRGWTAEGGRPHAEVRALTEAGAAARGATVYVTLEPCAHTGQTPPCAQALIDAAVGRVVIACRDPDPRVDGGGIAMLKAAGIDVDMGVGEAEATQDHAGFFSRIMHNQPFVTLKLATTLDGRIATRTGESQWITGPAARRAVHALRARHDAVMVGAGTARADDPQLTVRGLGPTRQPVRVVVSNALDLPTDLAMLSTTDTAPVWLCHGADAKPATFVAKQATSLFCKTLDGQVDLPDALKVLAARGITRVFCEGGSGLAVSLLKAGLVNQLELFQAGKIIGGDGLAALGSLGVDTLADVPVFACVSERKIGPDVWTTWRPAV
ncbi:MAG: bifunctional diaminohydroxyphosphoribosylaminopyrimidine deaminase/5-amino-6-(5-phosphoribosylamino)uracil reductase RibD [Pseudomonadota bacterium]